MTKKSDNGYSSRQNKQSRNKNKNASSTWRGTGTRRIINNFSLSTTNNFVDSENSPNTGNKSDNNKKNGKVKKGKGKKRKVNKENVKNRK